MLRLGIVCSCPWIYTSKQSTKQSRPVCSALIGRNLGTGTLPANFSAFQNLRYFDVPGNQLAGPLPASWGVNALATLTQLNLADNQAGPGTSTPCAKN